MGTPGDTLRKYRRIVELGRGGMATVHLAALRGPHKVTKLVVVKELQASRSADPEQRTMFIDEARLAARLNHPNVVQTFEIIEARASLERRDDVARPSASSDVEVVCALVMEYLEGQALNRVRARLKADPRALDLYLTVLVETLSGLEYAHSLKDYDGTLLHIVHRDINPPNIFITYSGEVKILDFGIAKASDSSSAPTKTGQMKGKLAYMAPEQARGERVDARADVFSCGVMLWEAIVGRNLWSKMTEAAIIFKLTQGDIAAPRDVAADAPERLDAICRRALAFDPRQRYATAAELREDLEDFLKTRGGRVQRRELGEVVAKAFAEERAEVRQIVEEQLSKITSVDSGHYKTLPPPPRLPGAIERASNPTSITKTDVANSIMPDVRGRTGLIVLFGVLAIAAAFFGAHAIPRSASPQTVTVVHEVPAAAPTATSRRALVVDPAHAAVAVDGATLAVGVRSIAGNKPVALHVEALGFESFDATVTFDTADPIVVKLNPIVQAAKPPSAPTNAKPGRTILMDRVTQ